MTETNSKPTSIIIWLYQMLETIWDKSSRYRARYMYLFVSGGDTQLNAKTA